MHLIDSKMEGKGGIFADDSKHGLGDVSAKGLVPDDDLKKTKMFGNTLQAFMKQNQNILSQVPTDAEIAELMKGKSKEEKMVLLKEIDQARQAKIHMEYLLEQQKLKNDERWAYRNVEERQALQAMYNHDIPGIVEEKHHLAHDEGNDSPQI